MKSQVKDVVYDDISGYGITIKNDGDIYLIIKGEEKKLDALIIKERKGN